MGGRSYVASSCVAIAVAACGARTTLFDEFSESSTSDAGNVDDAGRPLDSGKPSDAGGRDAATSDAGFDAAPILCAFTTQTVLANLAEAEADQIAVDDSYVYFHDNTTISRVAKSGGPVTDLATVKPPSWPDLSAFSLAASDVTWWQIDNVTAHTSINHVSKAGGAPTTVATLGSIFYYGTGGPAGSSYVWGGNFSSEVLDQIAANGTVTQIGSTLPAGTEGVAYDDGKIYAFGQNGVYRFDGTTFQSFASITPSTFPNFMVFDATNIFMTWNDETGGFGVSSIPKSGGAFTSILHVTQSYIGGVRADADHVWVVNRVPVSVPTPPSQILRTNKDGSDLTVFATAADSQIVDVAVDDLCVYWTETANTGATPSRVVAAPK